MIFVQGGGRVRDDMETRHFMLVMVSLYRSSPPLFLLGCFFFLLLLFSVHHQHLHRHDSHHRLSVALPHNIIIIDIYTAAMGPIVVPWSSVWRCLFFFLLLLLSIYIIVYFVTRKLCCRYRILPSYNSPT